MFVTEPYKVQVSVIPKDICNQIITLGEQQGLSLAKIQEGNQKNRKSKVSWIKSDFIKTSLKDSIQLANKVTKWNFSLEEYEPFQYTVYEKDDHYDWHIDTHNKPYDNGLVRKLSFTLCLNEDYEGGEFEICVPNPRPEKHTYIKLNSVYKIGTMIVFPSFVWHKVNPVLSGIRKTLVGWIVGKPFA